MTRPPAIRRIVPENFPEEFQAVADIIGASLNQFQQEVIQVLDHGVDYDNLRRELITVDVRIDGSGMVINRPSIRSTLTSKIRGAIVINSVNLDNPSIYPLQTPFISFTLRGNIIDILNVTGLQNNSQYRLTVELIG